MKQDSVVDGCSTSNGPDYESLEIPTKNPEEYSYAERRAELLQQVLDLGHPGLINQTREAERYDVSQQQISKDLNRLAEYIEENLGDHRELITEAVYHRAIRGLLEQEEYRKAAQTVTDWNEWVDKHDKVAELEERMDRIEKQQNADIDL